jgi:hypothetical protein
MEINDLEGNTINPGDRVAGAFRIGNVAVLRTGTVQGFGERGNNVTVIVNWDHDSEYAGRSESWRRLQSAVDITGAIEADKLRFVKIGG